MGNQATKKFDQAARNWDKKERRVRLAADIAAAMGKLPLSKGMTAMEYGCGTGLVGLALVPRLKHLTAVDTSQGMLDVLAAKAGELAENNVSTLLLDLSRHPSPVKVDFVFCSMTLHHIEDRDRILAAFFHALRPDGYLAIADLDQEDGSFHGDEAGHIPHFGFERTELQEQLETIGFRDVLFQTVHTLDKEVDGQKRLFPIFMVTARKGNVSAK